MKTAVLVYSLSGNTRRVAEAVATQLAAPLSILTAPNVRSSPMSMLRLGFATLFGRTTAVRVEGADPLQADCLILAAPVWASRLAVPMRSWLAQNPRLPSRVALIMTGGNAKPNATALSDFAAHARTKPVAVLYVSEAEIDNDSFSAACTAFCESVTRTA